MSEKKIQYIITICLGIACISSLVIIACAGMKFFDDSTVKLKIEDAIPTSQWENFDYRDSIVLVWPAEGFSTDDIIRVALDSNEVQSADKMSDDSRFVVVSLQKNVNVLSAVAAFNKLNCVKAAEPDVLYKPTDSWTPDAPRNVNDWGVLDQWSLEAMDVFEAWGKQVSNETNAVAGQTISIAIVDTGVDGNHPDLKDNIVAGYDIVSEEEVSKSFKYNTGEPESHGTHVAGIAAASANNEEGIAGSSYNAGIVAIQAAHEEINADGSSDCRFSTSDLCRSYEYILKNAQKYNIRVVNLSLSGGSRSADFQNMEESQFIDYVKEADRAGILTVAAAGNDNSQGWNWPSDYAEEILSVISLQKSWNPSISQYERSPFSNYASSDVNQFKDVSAPGSNILSTVALDDPDPSYFNGYGYLSGTSMAAPAVSGIAALMFSANPQLTPASVRSMLRLSCDDVYPDNRMGYDDEIGYGMVNALTAVNLAKGFKLQEKNNIESASVSNIKDKKYCGKEIVQNPKITYQGKILKEGSDYKLVYSDNIFVGTAKMQIWGKGQYSGVLSELPTACGALHR